MTALIPLRPSQVARPDKNPPVVYINSLEKSGQPGAVWALRMIVKVVSGSKEKTQRCSYESFPWHLLRHEHTQAIRAAIMGRYRPSTCRKILYSMKGTLRAAWDLGLIDTEDYHRAIAIKNVKGKSMPAGRALSAVELETIAMTAGRRGGLRALRDCAIIAVLYGAGLRRDEAVRLDVEAYKNGALTFRGKGNKIRRIPVIPGWNEYVEAWLAARPAKGPMFVAFDRRGPLTRRLSREGLNQIVAEIQKQAGVEAFTPHDLRRTYGTSLLDADVDLVTVRDLMGHENIATTALYDRRGEDAKRAAVAKLKRKR